MQATRPTRRDAPPHGIAVVVIRTWLRFGVQEMSGSIISGALEIGCPIGTLRLSPPGRRQSR